MKYLLILAFVVSCSSGQKKTEPVAATTPTESDAKPVSPYTVGKCMCMKIFEPVCAGGLNFGNSCEAECQGHKKWTQGKCPKK